MLWVHVPLSLAILGLYLTGSDCPVTTWELALRQRAGEPAYRGGFIGHYVTDPLGFPIHATSTQVGIYVLAFLPNVIGTASSPAALSSRGAHRFHQLGRSRHRRDLGCDLLGPRPPPGSVTRRSSAGGEVGRRDGEPPPAVGDQPGVHRGRRGHDHLGEACRRAGSPPALQDLAG